MVSNSTTGTKFYLLTRGSERVEAFIVKVSYRRKPRGEFALLRLFPLAKISQSRVFVPQLGVDDG